ncbi:HlyD family secretion protein [Phocaeicola sp.]|uniref:HlyD family secretion protein n=1 Tax=Phocaeicola sp. TaxID=2773926 RepID=UPI0023D03E2D|nr:HlyD family secretion protein [Phocaeicola sp.]MDE5676258.1 HlyD family secretion protein [Phocaeicola sp.]
MEEIYKPDTEKVEIYSRESNDMLGDMPEWLIHTGSYIVYGLVALLIAGAALFQYPDTVEKEIRIDDTGSVEWITANRAGMIECFFVENQSEVKKNDTLGILKNTAALEDVKRFCQVLTNVEEYYRTQDIDYLRDYPFDLIMGEMTPAYEQFTQAVRACLMYREFDLYPQKKKYLDEELKILTQNGKADELNLLKIKRELFDLEIDHKMEMSKNHRTLEIAYENMVNSLRTWDNNYLLKSHNNGTVIWGKSWSMNRKINEGDTLCTVVAQTRGTPAGHIRLSENEVSEIAAGDKVNIALNKYPAHTYGKLSGEIASISFVPHNKSYAIEVEFPGGMVTTSGKKLEYEIGMSGQAEIVTSSRSVLDRIFLPVMQLFKKQS